MKRTIIASVLAAFLVFPAGVLAHGDKHQGKQEDPADVGPEGAPGRPSGPGKAPPNETSVEPGKTGELIWQFTNAGTFDFACLEPGHFEAGMVGKVHVGRAAGTDPADRGRA